MRDLVCFAADPPDRPRSYAQAVRAGELIVTAGHLAHDQAGLPGSRSRPPSALTQLLATAERAGGARETILRIDAYLADIQDFEPPYLVEVDAIATTLIEPSR